MTSRLLQHEQDGVRRVIATNGKESGFVPGSSDIRTLALEAIEAGCTLLQLVEQRGLDGSIDIEAEYAAGHLRAPIAHPDPSRLHLTGTGLTHLGSAEGRDAMHRKAEKAETDSMRIFLEGLNGGKPAPGQIGSQPEWFYKGNGHHLVGPGEPLMMPDFAQDGGEEPELAGIYIIGNDGRPYRLGVCLANEFSDHVTERHNYLWLAHSKLRNASLGAELLLGPTPEDVRGTSRIRRDGDVIWEKPFLSGEANMSHSLANLEHHHFKYDLFRVPGDVHVHFFGTATASFADGIQTQPGDEFEIEAGPFALPLRNRLERAAPVTIEVGQL